MSGRITQYRNPLDYTRQLGILDALLVIASDVPHPRYNVGPGTRPFAIFADTTVRLAQWHAHGHHPARRLTDAAEDPALAPLWRAGRILVPADGWYAPHDAQGHAAPHYVRPKDGRTLYLPALSGASCADDEDACFTPLCRDGAVGTDGALAANGANRTDGTHATDGALVTDAAPAYLLEAGSAARWLDRRVGYEEAQQLLSDTALVDPDTLEWRPVGHFVNAASPDRPQLIRATA